MASTFMQNAQLAQRNRVAENLATLHALLAVGPLWDGDVPSKRERDNLLNFGFACRVIVAGADGYAAATSLGAKEFINYMAYRAGQSNKPTPSNLTEALACYASLS